MRRTASPGVLPPAYYSSDPFDFLLEECGNISAAQAAFHRRSQFLREEEGDALPPDARGLADHVVYRLFGSESFPCPDLSSSRRCSDAAAAELALVGYFLRLGPRRLHLLLPYHPPPHSKEGDGRRSRGLEPRASEPQTGPPPSRGGKEEAAALKRKLDCSAFPPPPSVPTADDRAVKNQRDVPARTADESSSQEAHRILAGDTGPSSVAIERGPHKQPPPPPPSTQLPFDGEGRGHDRRREPTPAPTAQMMTARPPRAGPDSPVEKAGGIFRADAVNVEAHELGETRASGARPRSSSALVQQAPPSAAGGDAVSPATFVDVPLRFSRNNPGRTLEGIDLLDVLAAKGFRLPHPEWWRPGGYGPSSSSPSPPRDLRRR